MAKLYYHRIENFNRLDSIKGVEGYAKRALTMASEDDVVLLDWYEDIIFPPPEIGLLNKCGFGCKPENVFVVDFDHRKTWRENYLKNRTVIEHLREMNLEKLLPFTGKASIVHLLAEELGIPVESCPMELARWGEDTATLLEIADESIRPRGYVCKNNEELWENWKRLKNLPGFIGKAVIKDRHSASGLGSSVVRSDEDVQNFLGSIGDFGETGGATIEEWYDNDIRSPSINYFIRKDGEIKELFISDQIFEDIEPEFGREGTRIHAGNYCPSTFPEEVQEKIRQITFPLAEKMKENGYWGPVGFDCIVVNGSKVLVAEINSRVTGPHYSFRPAKKYGFRYFRQRNEENLREDIDIEQVENALADFLFKPGKNAGYLVFNFYPGKKFTGAVIAQTPELLKDFCEEIDPVLEKLKK